MSNDSSQVESVNATQAVEDEQKETYSATRWVITGILWFLVGLPGLMSILGFIGGSWWMNTLANFRTQYVLLFAVMLLVTLVFRRFVLSLVCLLLAIASFLPIVPTFNSNVQANVDNGPSVKIVLMNVAHQYNQTEYQPAADLVSQEKPQLLLLQEVDKGWLTEFYDLVRDDYDLVSDGARPDHYGIALLARTTGDNIVKVRGAKSWPLTWRDESDALICIPHTEAYITLPGSDQEIYFYGIRTRPPLNKQRCDATETLIHNAIKSVNDQGKMPKIIIGDVNHTPWSTYIKQLMTETGTEVNSGAYGLQPTWFAPLPMPLRVPIDMVFFTDDLALYECRLGPSVNSTHLPLIVTLGPKTHMQRDTPTGLKGLLNSGEKLVEESLDKVKDAADTGATQNK